MTALSLPVAAHGHGRRRVAGVGALSGFVSFALTVALCRTFAFIPPGTRAEAVGVCLSTMALIAGGVVLGTVFRRIELHRLGLSKRPRLAAELGPRIKTPWSAAGAGALVASACALFALVLPNLGQGLFGVELIKGQLAHSAVMAQVILLPPLVLTALGAAIGAHARPRALPGVLLGFAILLALQIGGGLLALQISYDPKVVNAWIIAFTLLSFLLSGFFVAFVLKRLAFIELLVVSLCFGYALYLLAAVGGDVLLKRSNVPEEQILVALALAPSGLALCLLTVGASIGFLLVGSGRFDARFGYETDLAFRFLRYRTMGEVMRTMAAAFAAVITLGGTLIGGLLVRIVRRRRKGPKSTDFVNIIGGIALAGVCLGVLALVVVLSVMSGFEGDLKQKILGAHAHVVLGKKGDDFVEYAEVEKQVEQVEGVVSSVAFVMGEGMISSEAGLSGALVKGVDPDRYGASSDLRKNVEKGSLDHLLHPEEIPGARPRYTALPSSGTASIAEPVVPSTTGSMELGEETRGRRILPGIVIGRELAKTLRVYVGDTVNLVSPFSEEIGPTGPEPKLRRFRVAGIFFSGMYEYDSKFAYVEMRQAQKFFGMRGRATGVEIRVDDIDDTPRIVEELKRRVGGHPYTVKDWREMNKELFSALLLEKLAMFIILTFIVLVASFNIISTLVMIVLEKGREIAILKSMGSTEASIMKAFVVQGLIVGVGGALLGLAGGIGICLFIDKVGIDLDPDVFYINKLPVLMDWGEIAVIAAAAVVITYLAAIYPAMAASQLSPVEGLRDEG